MEILTQQPALAVAVILALAAAVSSLTLRMIPNSLAAAGLASGIVLSAWTEGAVGVPSALFGASLAFLLFLPFRRLNGMGSGDIKMMAAIGSCLRPLDVIALAAIVAVAGSAIVLARAAQRRVWPRLGAILPPAWIGKTRAIARRMASVSRARLKIRPAEWLPYGLPAGLGLLGCTLIVAVVALEAQAEPSGSRLPARPVQSVINSVGHEASAEKTRVILRADGPIDYRGGILKGDQVILDLANVRIELEKPVIELGTPEVDRLVIGPEITRDGERLLKIRLTGVKARSHKVIVKGNELFIDLTPRKKPTEEKGFPKVIFNDDETTA